MAEAGIVLAVLPLVIEGLRVYANAMETMRKWRNYGRILQDIIRALEMEVNKLENSCSRLLFNCGILEDLEPYLKDLWGELWTKPPLLENLQEQLGPSMDVFFGAVRDITDIVEELERSWGIGRGKEVSANESRCV